MKGNYNKLLDKVVYLDNRRFLPHSHPLRKECHHFPSGKSETRAAPKNLSNKNLLHGHVAYDAAANKTQAGVIAKATGCKSVNCFMLLPNFDRTKQAYPDVMHTLKNAVVEIFNLITGREDTIKVRKAEESLGRFGTCCSVSYENG